MQFIKLPKKGDNRGFTLIEILVVIGIIAVLAAVVLIAINPARQFQQARDSQRTSNVNAILNAVGQNFADNAGIFTCTASTTIPTSAEVIGSAGSEFDIRDCLVPDYIPEIPVDPRTGTAWTGSEYSTGYTIFQSSTTSRITISAPDAELDTISVTR